MRICLTQRRPQTVISMKLMEIMGIMGIMELWELWELLGYGILHLWRLFDFLNPFFRVAMPAGTFFFADNRLWDFLSPFFRVAMPAGAFFCRKSCYEGPVVRRSLGEAFRIHLGFML